ncbi:MAG: LOG family protein [Patescibacteria group bacterium]
MSEKNNYYLRKKRRVIGDIIQAAEVKNEKAWVAIHKSSKNEMATYESQGLIVSINGSGTLNTSHPDCLEASRLADYIARQGGIIMNGGRSSGIMEASSKMAGKNSLGIIFPEIKKEINSYGEKAIVNSPQPRNELLATCAPAIVIFRGGLGTLMVLLRSIVHVKDMKYHPLQLPQIIFVSNYWIGLLTALLNMGTLPREFLVTLNFFDKAEQVIEKLPAIK